MFKYFTIITLLMAIMSCNRYSVFTSTPHLSLDIKLTDTLRAKPPINAGYDEWVAKYPIMKEMIAIGGTYDDKNGLKFKIAIWDKNKNLKHGEIDKDFIYLVDYQDKYVEWDNSCSNVSVVRFKNIIDYDGNYFEIDSINPAGEFITLKKIPLAENPNLIKNKNLPLKTKISLFNGGSISIQECLSFLPDTLEYVYVNFWAPWCAPCLQEIPQLKILSNKNIALINICEELSFDDAQNAISKYSIPGIQGFGNDELYKKFNYCGSGYPFGILYKGNYEINRGIRAHQVVNIVKKP